MRAAALAGVVAAAVLAAAAPACPRRAGAPVRDPLEVTFVADGDTVRGRWRGRQEWVRLLRIDTPERDRAGYQEARSALAAMLEGRRDVEIEFESPGLPERDRHGRLLAYLFAGRANLNVEMVRAGWSRFWTRYGEGRYGPGFRDAEREAREGGRGIWGRRRGAAGSR